MSSSNFWSTWLELVVPRGRWKSSHRLCVKVKSSPPSSHLCWGDPRPWTLCARGIIPAIQTRGGSSQGHRVKCPRALCETELGGVLFIFDITTLMLIGDSRVLSIYRGLVSLGWKNSSKEKQPLWGRWWMCHSKKPAMLLYHMAISQLPIILSLVCCW